MKTITTLILFGMVSPLGAQCVNCQPQWEVPNQSTTSYTGSMSNTCQSRQRIGNKFDLQVGLINVHQVQQETDGSRQKSVIGRNRSRTRVRIFRRWRR